MATASDLQQAVQEDPGVTSASPPALEAGVAANLVSDALETAREYIDDVRAGYLVSTHASISKPIDPGMTKMAAEDLRRIDAAITNAREMAEAVRDLIGLIGEVAPAYAESPMVAFASAAIAKAEGRDQ